MKNDRVGCYNCDGLDIETWRRNPYQLSFKSQGDTMKKSTRSLGTAVAGAMALFAMACNQGENANPSSSPATKLNTASPSKEMKPIAQIALSKDHSIEFYDFGNDALIAEVGKAGDAHYFNDQNEPQALLKNGTSRTEILSQVWKSISPETPVPAALLDIQARWKNAPPSQPKPAGIDVKPFEASGLNLGLSREFSAPLQKTAAPVGCNNGCCDYQWLSTFKECKLVHDYNWFLYNYGWSYANSGDVDYYEGMVCAATGTSTFKMNMSDGTGGTWTVPQATYRRVYWTSGFWGFNRTLTSSVNSSANSHLHTYCGGINH
jgi:hypothetical protein